MRLATILRTWYSFILLVVPDNPLGQLKSDFILSYGDLSPINKPISALKNDNKVSGL